MKAPSFVGRDIISAVKTGIALLTLVFVLAACTNSTTPTMQTTKATSPASGSPSRAPDENAALDTVRKITEAQATYFKLNRRYALTYDELIEGHLLNTEPSAAQTGYDFKLRPAADAQTYTLSVVPAETGGSGAATVRSFFTDQTGVIRAETGKDATADSSAVK